MQGIEGSALGMVETKGLVAALQAADAMLKAARVRLLGLERTDAALITVQVLGDTAAVQSAVDAGRAAAEAIGQVVSTHVIPHPDEGVSRMQMGRLDSPEASPRHDRGSDLELERMTVRELRALARKRETLSIQGREIARANKEQLVEALRSRPS